MKIYSSFEAISSSFTLEGSLSMLMLMLKKLIWAKIFYLKCFFEQAANAKKLLAPLGENKLERLSTTSIFSGQSNVFERGLFDD